MPAKRQPTIQTQTSVNTTFYINGVPSELLPGTPNGAKGGDCIGAHHLTERITTKDQDSFFPIRWSPFALYLNFALRLDRRFCPLCKAVAIQQKTL